MEPGGGQAGHSEWGLEEAGPLAEQEPMVQGRGPQLPRLTGQQVAWAR